MSHEDLDYEKDMLLDQHALDYEWLRQASLFQKYSVVYADACADKDDAKEKLLRVDAEIDLDIRQNWRDYGFDVKPTEPAIKAAVVLDPRHIKASKEFVEASRYATILQGSKVALEHKKAALERLSALYLSGYWADPRVTKEAKENYNQTVQSAHRSQLEKNERIKRHGQR